MKKMADNVVYIPKGFTEVNGPVSNRSVRAKQEAIANPLNTKYVEATQVNSVVNEQSKVEEITTPVKSSPATEQPIAPDISINSFSIEKPAPTPTIGEVETPVNNNATPSVDTNSMDEKIVSIPVPEPVVAVEETFVPPVAPIAESPKEEIAPSTPSIDPIQNNGFGIQEQTVNDITMSKENIVNLNDEVVINYLKEKLAQSTKIDELRSIIESQKKELEAKDKKLSAVNNALAQIQATVNSQQLEEPAEEVYKKAA